jgi:D-lactate dehydrogenase
MKTLFYSTHKFDKPFIEKANDNKHNIEFIEESLNENTASLAKGFDAVALFTSDDASSSILEKLSSYGVKHIALRSVGYDHVNLDKAKQLGIKVANVPSYSPYSIAEHAVALLLALNRKLILGQAQMQKVDYSLDNLIGFDLHGKTIGIIGTGKIGAAFANIMHGFGCKLLAFDIIDNKELQENTNVTYTTFEDLCKNSDVISLHCPMNAKTKNMFHKAVFEKMKKGVVFINTARGGLVKTIDLIEAIDNGTILLAGLDVYENEKPIFMKDHKNGKITDELFLKLRSYPNVLITGHQAFLTNEALEGIAFKTIENMDAWQLNGSCVNEL